MDVSFFVGRKIDTLGGEDRDKYIEEIIGHKLDPVLDQRQRKYFKNLYKEMKYYKKE